MGLRDLLGVRKPKAEQPAAASLPTETGTLPEEIPTAASETLDTEPISERFGAPAEMLGKDLPKVMPGGGYNPYSGLGGPFDQSMSKAIYALSDTPEFLFDEERSMHRRSWSENLTFLTGVGYLGGILVGGGWGIYSGLQAKPEAGMIDTSKLKLNRVLNAVSARGRMLGNAWGCVGLYYAGIESFTMSYFEHRYDTMCSLAAGAGAGALYKSMSGPRAVAVYGAAGAVLSGINLAAQSVIGRR